MIDKNKNIVVTVVFSLFLLSFFLVNIFKKDTLISTSERRKLEQFPKFTSESLFNGTFFKSLIVILLINLLCVIILDY